MHSNKNIFRLFGKWYIVILLMFFLQLGLESCSMHGRQRKMIKRRKKYSAIKRYRSPYQRRVSRQTMPINKNYLLRYRNTNKSSSKGTPPRKR